tara:strand:- start:31 stop:174 length:144 start_codon:yes stop_codon:yes gene_type:complete
LYCLSGKIAGLLAAIPSWSSKNADEQHPQRAIVEFIESIYEQDKDGS